MVIEIYSNIPINNNQSKIETVIKTMKITKKKFNSVFIFICTSVAKYKNFYFFSYFCTLTFYLNSYLSVFIIIFR